MKLSEFPDLGFGVGLRHPYFSVFLEGKYGEIEWVEALTENYLPWEDGQIRRPFTTLKKIREKLPIALHGVSLSIGSVDPINEGYLRRLKELAHIIQPAWISDHVCWTGIHGQNMHDLLPMPYTREAIDLIITKVDQIQNTLKRRILLENVSSYVEFGDSQYTEWEFLKEILTRSDCGLLLDINNIYVSSINHQFNPMDYLQAIPVERVGQIHLAGHTNRTHYLIDTHDDYVCDEVWELYRWAVNHFGKVSTMIEWDDKFPSWDILYAEVMKIKKIAKEERASERVPSLERTARTL